MSLELKEKLSECIELLSKEGINSKSIVHDKLKNLLSELEIKKV